MSMAEALHTLERYYNYDDETVINAIHVAAQHYTSRVSYSKRFAWALGRIKADYVRYTNRKRDDWSNPGEFAEHVFYLLPHWWWPK